MIFWFRHQPAIGMNHNSNAWWFETPWMWRHLMESIGCAPLQLPLPFPIPTVLHSGTPGHSLYPSYIDSVYFRDPNLVITIIPADNLAHNGARPRNRNMIPCEFLWLQWISYIFVNQMTSFKMADEMRRTHVLLGCVTTYIRVTLVHESIQGFQGLPNRHLGVVELAPMRFLKRKYIF